MRIISMFYKHSIAFAHKHIFNTLVTFLQSLFSCLTKMNARKNIREERLFNVDPSFQVRSHFVGRCAWKDIVAVEALVAPHFMADQKREGVEETPWDSRTLITCLQFTSST